MAITNPPCSAVFAIAELLVASNVQCVRFAAGRRTQFPWPMAKGGAGLHYLTAAIIFRHILRHF